MTRKGGLIYAIIMSVVLTVAVVYVKISNNRLDRKQRETSFCGVIQQLSFDEKHIPTVSIKGVEYYLSVYDPDIRDIIRVNDSIVKQENSTNYLLYRKDSAGVWRLIHERK